YIGLDAVSADVSMHIDPSGRQSPNTATVTLNEHILVYAKRNINKTETTGSLETSFGSNASLGTGSLEEAASNLINQDPSTRSRRNDPKAAQESGNTVENATL